MEKQLNFLKKIGWIDKHKKSNSNNDDNKIKYLKFKVHVNTVFKKNYFREIIKIKRKWTNLANKT